MMMMMKCVCVYVCAYAGLCMCMYVIVSVYDFLCVYLFIYLFKEGDITLKKTKQEDFCYRLNGQTQRDANGAIKCLSRHRGKKRVLK